MRTLANKRRRYVPSTSRDEPDTRRQSLGCRSKTPGQREGSQRSSNRLDPSDRCCCCKEHRKKVRFVRPGQSEAEQGDQGNCGELPYFGVQSVRSHLLLPHTGGCARSGWHPWP